MKTGTALECVSARHQLGGIRARKTNARRERIATACQTVKICYVKVGLDRDREYHYIGYDYKRRQNTCTVHTVYPRCPQETRRRQRYSIATGDQQQASFNHCALCDVSLHGRARSIIVRMCLELKARVAPTALFRIAPYNLRKSVRERSCTDEA